jgi:hypothetical protein
LVTVGRLTFRNDDNRVVMLVAAHIVTAAKDRSS